MVKLKLVLDSNVFKSREFCRWLLSKKEEKYLPAIAYMEYLEHHLKKGNTESMVDAFLEQMNITIVPFGKEEAAQEAKSSTKNPDNQNMRNYAIGATAISIGAQLVTNNQENFKWMDNVLTPDDIMEK